MRWYITGSNGSSYMGRGNIDLLLEPGRYDVSFTTAAGKVAGQDWWEVRPGDDHWYLRGSEPWPELEARPFQPHLF